MRSETENEVWVLLDNQRYIIDLLSNAATMARLMNATLQGVFIEEENLVRAAELSISRDISSWLAQENEISKEIIQRTLHSKARHNKKQLETVARDNNIQCSFQVVQGERMPWIRESKKTPRILFLGGNESTAKTYQQMTYCNMGKDPVMLLYKDSIASKRALNVALQMTAILKHPLLVLVLSDDITDKSAITEQLNESLGEQSDTTVNIQFVNEVQLLELLHRLKANMFVFPDDIKLIQDDNNYLEKLIQRVRCPVVLIQ